MIPREAPLHVYRVNGTMVALKALCILLPIIWAILYIVAGDLLPQPDKSKSMGEVIQEAREFTKPNPLTKAGAWAISDTAIVAIAAFLIGHAMSKTRVTIFNGGVVMSDKGSDADDFIEWSELKQLSIVREAGRRELKADFKNGGSWVTSLSNVKAKDEEVLKTLRECSKGQCEVSG